MKLSRSLAYALCAMIDLARAEPGIPVPCSTLASTGNMPERFLLQILRGLVIQGLLRSTRGVEGGYCLSRAPSEITLHEIVQAFNSTLEPGATALSTLKSSARDRVLTALERADRASQLELEKLTLADLLRSSG